MSAGLADRMAKGVMEQFRSRVEDVAGPILRGQRLVDGSRAERCLWG